VNNLVDACSNEEKDENSNDACNYNDMLPPPVVRAPNANNQAEAHISEDEDEDDNSSQSNDSPLVKHEPGKDTTAPVCLVMKHDPNEESSEDAASAIDEEVAEDAALAFDEEGQLSSLPILLHLENLLDLEMMNVLPWNQLPFITFWRKPTLSNGKF
jgi:hypothetical protein